MGTKLQERIIRSLISDFKNSVILGYPIIISLNEYYRFNLELDFCDTPITLRNFGHTPWYDRPPVYKLSSLLFFSVQIIILSLKFNNFVFFVDTGILERTAIILLKSFGCRTIVLQDAIKRIPRHNRKEALTYFGGGKAGLYLLTGRQYISMMNGNNFKVVGSPIYNNKVIPTPLGNKILILNQCFARYGEISEANEILFIKEVVRIASRFGTVELRLHPHNNYRIYEHLNNQGVEVSQDKPIEKSLKEAAIVLAVNSTAILEALILMRPVVTMEWHPSPFEQPVKNVVIHCKNLRELIHILENFRDKGKKNLIATSQEEIQDEIKEFIAYSGKESIKRTIDALENFLME